jgi:hypothetical protein
MASPLEELLKYKYYTISYDLRVDKMDTEVNDSVIQDNLAILLVYNDCEDIECFTETTVHFKSTKSPEFWYEEIIEYFGDYLVFILERVAVNKNHEPVRGIHLNENYERNYPSKLHVNYRKRIKELKEHTKEDLKDELDKFFIGYN